MNEFTSKYAASITGTLSGFDRLVFRGSLRQIAYPFGMLGYLWAKQVPLTAFGAHVNKISGQVKEAACGACNRPAARCGIYSPAKTTRRPSRARLPGRTRLSKVPCVP